MPTSNVTIYQLSRDELITAALRKLGVLPRGQSPDSSDIADGAMALNMIIAEFRGIGMPLWARKYYTFSPTENDIDYEIGISKTLNTAYPLHVLQAYREDSTASSKIDIQVVPNFNFNLFPIGSSGIPIQLTYQPKVNYGVISLWPTPDSWSESNITITIVYQAPFQYFDAASDTMDFPEEWYNAIVYALAVSLAPEWGIPLPDRQDLKKEAKMHLENALENGYEDASLFIQPDRYRN